MKTCPTISRRTALGLLATLVPLGCTRNEGPIDPVWGKEPCAHCRMLVGDKRAAAQGLADGERLFFDDIGCLALWLDAHEKPGAPVRSWVRDAAGTGWLEARTARYASGARTPMDFGFEGSTTGGVDFEAMREAVRAKTRGTR